MSSDLQLPEPIQAEPPCTACGADAVIAGRCHDCGAPQDGQRGAPSVTAVAAVAAYSEGGASSPAPEPQAKGWWITLDSVEAEVVERLVTTLPLWRRKVVTVAGDGETGKSWVAAYCAREVADAGGRVLVLDGEMSAASWRRRLEQIGTAPEALSRIAYATMESATRDRLAHKVSAADLVVIDSAVTYLSRNARSENDNAEVTRAYDGVIAAARSGPCVLVVDHLARTAAAAVPRGATAKFTALDVAYGVTLAEGSSPGRDADWSSVITVEKDRDGLHAHRRDYLVTFHPTGGGCLHLDLVESFTESHRLSTSAADQAYRRICALDPPPRSANDAHKRVGGNRSVALSAYKRWAGGSL